MLSEILKMAETLVADNEDVVLERNISTDEIDTGSGMSSTPAGKTTSVSLDEIAAKLIRDKFLLTALELHTELVEHGRELPRLRDFFSNPGNFERQGDSFVYEQSSSLPRTSSIQTFDSLDFTRYSDDGDRQVDEKVAVLEFELRKARETIKSLRANLTEAAESEVTTPDNNFDHFRGGDDSIKPHERRALNFLVNEYLLRHNYKLTSITFSDENDEQDFEDWDDVGLNVPKPPSLLHLYRDSYRHLHPTTLLVDRAVQVDIVDPYSDNLINGINAETQSDMPLCRLPAENSDSSVSTVATPLLQSNEKNDESEVELIVESDEVIRRFSEVTCSTSSLNISMNRSDSFICSVCGHNRGNDSSVRLLPLSGDAKGDSSIIISVSSEPSEKTESVTDCELSMFPEDTAQVKNNSRQCASVVAPVFRCRRHVSSAFEAILLNLCKIQRSKQESRLAKEVSEVIDSSDKVVKMLARSLPYIVPNVILAKREELIPLILATISLHPSAIERDQLLNILFNLIKRPDDEQRSMILNGFVAVARCIGPTRVESELLPQCWEQINHKYLERRLLVAESCAVLIPYIPIEICSSLVWSMLQQMLLDDKADVVRESVVRSFSLLVTFVEDDNKFIQGLQLLISSLCDTSERVVAVALQLLLPCFASWAKEANRLESELVLGIVSAIADRINALEKSAPSMLPLHLVTREHKDITSLINAFLYLLPWMFVTVVENVPKSSSRLSHVDSRPVDVGRFPPDLSPLCDINIIIGSENEASTLIRQYEDYIGEEWYDTWPEFEWITKTLLPRVVKLSFDLDLSSQNEIHALCQFTYWFCRIFGHRFTMTKMRIVFQEMLTLSGEDHDSNSLLEKSVVTRSIVPVYAAGVLHAFNKDEDRKLLHQFLHELVIMVSLCHLPLTSVEVAFVELRTNSSNHDVLLSVLWDIVVHTSALVRSSASKLFCLLIGAVGDNLLSTRVAPALVTLANDPEITVRISTVATFGAILQFTVQKDLLDKAQMQLQTFLDDPLYKDQHTLHVEIIWTFGRIAPHSDPKFRDEFVLPHLVALASRNNHRVNETRRTELALALLDAFSAIACCFISEQMIHELLLPGLRFLLSDIQQLAPENETTVVNMIQEFESKMEVVRPHERTIVSGTSTAAVSIEDVRNRVKANIQNMFQLRKK